MHYVLLFSLLNFSSTSTPNSLTFLLFYLYLVFLLLRILIHLTIQLSNYILTTNSYLSNHELVLPLLHVLRLHLTMSARVDVFVWCVCLAWSPTHILIHSLPPCHSFSISTLLYSTLLYSIILYSTLFNSTLLYSILFFSTLFNSSLLYSTRFYSIQFYSILYSTRFNSSLTYSTLLFSILFDIYHYFNSTLTSNSISIHSNFSSYSNFNSPSYSTFIWFVLHCNSGFKQASRIQQARPLRSGGVWKFSIP